jgi:hypothetical protein
MKYRNRTDGSLVTKSQLKAQNTNTSLPKVWTAATLEFLGVDPVLASPKPELGDYEVAVADGARFVLIKPDNVSGNWVEAWKVQPMFPEYTDDDGKVVTEAEQIAAYEAQKAAERRSKMECTPRQARLALASAGLYEAVQTSVAAVSDEARIEWEYATMIERTNPIIINMQTELGISDEALDGLFDLAVTL